MVGPMLFLAVVLVEGAVRPGYNPWRNTISELSLGPRGWIQATNFLMFGVLLLVFTRGLRGSLADSRAASVGCGLLLAIGFGVLLSGLFRAEPWPPSSMSTSGLIHLLSAVGLIFALLPAACGVLARAFSAEPRWRALASFTGFTAAATLLLFVGGLALMSPPGQPPRFGNQHAGLIQRIDVSVFLVWLWVTAWRLKRPPSAFR